MRLTPAPEGRVLGQSGVCGVAAGGVTGGGCATGGGGAVPAPGVIAPEPDPVCGRPAAGPPCGSGVEGAVPAV